jgi:hypothetical protein
VQLFHHIHWQIFLLLPLKYEKRDTVLAAFLVGIPKATPSTIGNGGRLPLVLWIRSPSRKKPKPLATAGAGM